jgi:hypothetical protein
LGAVSSPGGKTPIHPKGLAKEPKTLDDLFHDTLKDIYFSEKKILTTLPKMAKAAQSEELKAGIREASPETEGQIERLETVSPSSNRNRRARPAQRSMASRRRVPRSWKNIRALRHWTPASLPPRRQSNTTRFPATAR